MSADEQIFFDRTTLGEELDRHTLFLKARSQKSQPQQPLKFGSRAYQTIASFDHVSLRHYPATAGATSQQALVICYALVNRPDILDLTTGRSLIERLNEAGIDIYLVDWGSPSPLDSALDLDDCVSDYLDRCISKVCTRVDSSSVDLLGVCQGGVLSLLYAARYPHKVRRLLTMVTPVDFAVPDFTLAQLCAHLDASPLVQLHGNIPGRWLVQAFVQLHPLRLGPLKLLMEDHARNSARKAREFMQMEYWINDCPDHPGQLFIDMVEKLFKRNELVAGDIVIDGRPTKLDNIRCPVLNLYAARDQLIPPSASMALKRFIAADNYQAVRVDAGHIGAFISRTGLEQSSKSIVKWLTDTPV